MFGKLAEAVRLLVGNFPLIAMLVLTVWLPANLLVNYLTFFVLDPDNTSAFFRASFLIESVVGPLYLGSMIYAVWQIKQGQTVGYAEAIGAGLSNWVRLFAARLIANLMISVGLLAFIVPGVMMALRYALLDCAVVIEGAGPSQARRRSSYLTKDVRSQILVLTVLFYLVFLLASFFVYFPVALVEETGQIDAPLAMILNGAADCVLDTVYTVLQIAMFLYYWDERQPKLLVSTPAGTEDGCADASSQPGELQDDGNPYRSP